MVEYSAFNRIVLGSSPRHPILKFNYNPDTNLLYILVPEHLLDLFSRIGLNQFKNQNNSYKTNLVEIKRLNKK